MSSPKPSYKPPFVRQVLPWLFILAFCITAPLIILYTSGYRYNLKKGFIERNGTFIIDSTPSNADIFIDGRATGERTPITLQNIVPGWHTIRVEKSKYTPWQDTLLVRAERVTFANQIWLWRTGEASLVQEGNLVTLQTDPLREKALIVSQTDAGLTSQIWTPGQSLATGTPLPAAASTTNALVTRWSSDGQGATLTDEQTNTTWWLHTLRGKTTLETLPKGTYHWSGAELIGNSGTASLRFNASLGTITTIPSAKNVVEESGELQIQSSTSTEHRTLLDGSFLTRHFLLPTGKWVFDEIRRPFVLLRDGIRWLAVEIKFGQPYAETLEGDYPRWSPERTSARAVFLKKNELWLWTMGEAPTLLWRQSEPLVQVVWHRSGTVLLVADRTHLFALDLTAPTTGLTAPLATFDDIKDLTIIDRTPYLIASKDGKSGIWRLPIE